MSRNEEEITAEQQQIQKLANAFLKCAEDQNPTYEVSFAALAAMVVGLSIQYVHAGLGEITAENLSEQLTRFQGYASELGVAKMQKINEQLQSLRILEEHAETLKRNIGEDISLNSQVQE